MVRKALYILWVVPLLSSCYLFKKKEEALAVQEVDKKVVARVFDAYLYEDDLKMFIKPGDHPKEDSIKLAKGYINSWIKKQVMLKKAEKNIQGSMREIEEKVDQYRYDLIIYEYQRNYLDDRLDKNVTDDQIEEYYQKNMKDFELKQNIVKCNFIKLRKDAPKLSKMLPLFKSTKPKDQSKFRGYILQYAASYSMDDDVWYDFNEVVSQTPFATYQNQVQFLQRTKFAQESDDNYVYLLKILEYKISDQISPLEFVKERIRSIIVNKRKVELLKKLEQGVYDQAQSNGDFEIL